MMSALPLYGETLLWPVTFLQLTYTRWGAERTGAGKGGARFPADLAAMDWLTRTVHAPFAPSGPVGRRGRRWEAAACGDLAWRGRIARQGDSSVSTRGQDEIQHSSERPLHSGADSGVYGRGAVRRRGVGACAALATVLVFSCAAGGSCAPPGAAPGRFAGNVRLRGGGSGPTLAAMQMRGVLSQYGEDEGLSSSSSSWGGESHGWTLVSGGKRVGDVDMHDGGPSGWGGAIEEMTDGSDDDEGSASGSGSDEESEEEGGSSDGRDGGDAELREVLQEAEDEVDMRMLGRASSFSSSSSSSSSSPRSGAERHDRSDDAERAETMALELHLPREMFRAGPWKVPLVLSASGDLSKVPPGPSAAPSPACSPRRRRPGGASCYRRTAAGARAVCRARVAACQRGARPATSAF